MDNPLNHFLPSWNDGPKNLEGCLSLGHGRWKTKAYYDTHGLYMCKDHTTIAQITLTSRARVSFYISLLLHKVKKPSTPKAAFTLARRLRDGRRHSSPFVGACAATFWKHRHRSAISWARRSSSTLVRVSTRSDEGRPFWNGPRADAPSNPRWNRCGKVVV